MSRKQPHFPRPFQIPELKEAIISHLNRPSDLLHLALSTKLLLEGCIRKFWQAPAFPGSPLRCMLGTFPEDVRRHLQEEDKNYRVPINAFNRFDYYAQYVRNLTLWHDEREDHISNILVHSRPEQPLFPYLKELHLGASGQQMVTASAYFSPVLVTARLNYWSLPLPDNAAGRQAVKKALIQLCDTETLTTMDLMDTAFFGYEGDPDIVRAFLNLAQRVEVLQTRSFVTLKPVFKILSENPRLRSVLFDLQNMEEGHVGMEDITRSLQSAFLRLRSLSLSCSLQQAQQILSEGRRGFEEISVEVDGAVEAGQLFDLLTSMYIEESILRHLQITSSGALECEVEPPLRLTDAIQPLLACKNLRCLQLCIPFEWDQSPTDGEMQTLLSAWPGLETCIIDSDPSGDDIPSEEEPTDDVLTLDTVVYALTHCSRLTELSLPFVNTGNIPDVEGLAVEDANLPFSLRISRSHVHNLAEVARFVAQLRPNAEVSVSGCADFPAARIPQEDFEMVG